MNAAAPEIRAQIARADAEIADAEIALRAGRARRAKLLAQLLQALAADRADADRPLFEAIAAPAEPPPAAAGPQPRAAGVYWVWHDYLGRDAGYAVRGWAEAQVRDWLNVNVPGDATCHVEYVPGTAGAKAPRVLYDTTAGPLCPSSPPTRPDPKPRKKGKARDGRATPAPATPNPQPAPAEEGGAVQPPEPVIEPDLEKVLAEESEADAEGRGDDDAIAELRERAEGQRRQQRDIDAIIRHAAGDARRWDAHREAGATEAQIRDTFHPGSGQVVSHTLEIDGRELAYSVRGGRRPALWVGWHRGRSTGPNPDPTFSGPNLYRQLRRVLAIPEAGPGKPRRAARP